MKTPKLVLFFAACTLCAQTAPPPTPGQPANLAAVPSFLDATKAFVDYAVAQNNGKAAQVAALQAQITQLNADKAALQTTINDLRAQLAAAGNIPPDWLPHIQALINSMTATLASAGTTGPLVAKSSDPGARNALSLQTVSSDPAKDGLVLIEFWNTPSTVGRSERWFIPYAPQTVAAEKTESKQVARK